jgi:MFS family permease
VQVLQGNKLTVIGVLGTTQTLAWASSYYLPAILADRIAHDVGVSSTWFFGAFSGALVVSALVGPRVGRTVDAIGGREVLAASNVVIAAGLGALAFVHTETTLLLAWLVLGVGMDVGLYDTAFAALGRIYGTEARSAITGITLIAGFASTVGWPLTAWGASALGWRETCLLWSAAHLLLGLPLNWFLLPKAAKFAVAYCLSWECYPGGATGMAGTHAVVPAGTTACAATLSTSTLPAIN